MSVKDTTAAVAIVPPKPHGAGMEIVHCTQYSPEWFEARRGVPTASAFSRIMTPTGKYSRQSVEYINELIGDLADQRPTAFKEGGRMGTPDMQYGREAEPHARRWLAVERGYEVREVGFVKSPCGRFGCSPDALVWNELECVGAAEIKCPLPKTHVGYIVRGVLPPEYKPQVHGQLIVTGLPWVDFISYCVSLPPLLVRVTPDGYTERLRVCLERFWLEYQATVEKVRGVIVGSRDE